MNISSKKIFAFSVVAFVSVNVFGGVFAEDNLSTEDTKIDTKVEIENINETTTLKKEKRVIPLELEKLFIEGTSIAGTDHTINVEAKSSKDVLYRFKEKNLKTGKWTIIQDYSEKSVASWIPKLKGDYLYGVDIKEVASKRDSDISKYVPIKIQPSIPAELESLEIKGTKEARTPHTITAKATGVNGVLYRFHVKDASTGRWTTIQDYSSKNSVDWMPEKTGNYSYAVHVKDAKSFEDREAQSSKSIIVEPLKPAIVESLELEGSKYEKKNHVITAKATSTNGVLYRFHVKDWSTGRWRVIQDYSTKNTVNWKPDHIGKYSYLVAVKDKNSEKERDMDSSYVVTINPPVYYNVSNYGDTVKQAVDKQMNVSGTKPQTTKAGKWVNASRDEVESFLKPDRFLQFKPEGGTNTSHKEGTVTTNGLNVRSGPSVDYGVIGKTDKGRVHKVLSEKNGWYMIDLDGVHGWVSGAYLSFPEADKGENKYLISIEVVVSGLNVRQNPTVSSPSLTTVSNGSVFIVLEEKTGWYKINSGGKIGWVSADHVRYVNDVPREMYQFMVLSGQAGVTVSQMNAELVGKGILAGKGAAFIEGSRKYNVNELYLMAHAFLETGNGTSKLATGVLVDKVKGKPVEPRVVYNMYGIGAFDASPLQSGSERAYELGWFTPEIAITEGAHWISTNYINNKTYKQDTLYKMKWNPSKPGTHQYATDIAWAFKQIKQIENVMEYSKRIDGVVLRFDIPVYR